MRLLVFIGPSGSGKSTVVRELHRQGTITVTPSWTTRPRRPDEVDGLIEHRFATEDEFTRLAHAGFFLEVVRPFGLSFRYGLPPVERPDGAAVAAVMVRAPLVPLVDRHYPDHAVYQIEDDYGRSRTRVLDESRAELALGTRLDAYEDERLLGRQVAGRVFVNATSPAALVSAVAAAINHDFPERSRPA